MKRVTTLFIFSILLSVTSSQASEVFIVDESLVPIPCTSPQCEKSRHLFNINMALLELIDRIPAAELESDTKQKLIALKKNGCALEETRKNIGDAYTSGNNEQLVDAWVCIAHIVESM